MQPLILNFPAQSVEQLAPVGQEFKEYWGVQVFLYLVARLFKTQFGAVRDCGIQEEELHPVPDLGEESLKEASQVFGVRVQPEHLTRCPPQPFSTISDPQVQLESEASGEQVLSTHRPSHF